MCNLQYTDGLHHGKVRIAKGKVALLNRLNSLDLFRKLEAPVFWSMSLLHFSDHRARLDSHPRARDAARVSGEASLRIFTEI